MKWYKSIIGLVLFCTSWEGNAQMFSIQGNLKHVPDGTVLELLADKPFGYEVIAKDTLKQGAFSFQDSVPDGYPRLLLRAQGKLFPKVLLPIWVAPGETVQIEGRNRLVRHWAVKSNLPEQIIENQFTEATRSESQAQMQAMLARRRWMDDRMKHEGDRTFQLRANHALDSLKTRIDSLDRAIARKEFALLKEMPVSPAWYYHYKNVAIQSDREKDTAYVAQVKALYEQVPEEVRMTPIGSQIATYVYTPPKVQVGGQEIRIIEEKICENGNSLGKSIPASGIIKIYSTYGSGLKQSDTSKINTFYHELTHCILDTMGEYKLSRNEKFVTTFSGFLTEAMRSMK